MVQSHQEAALQQLVETLAANPSVHVIGVDPLGSTVDLWVRLGDGDEGNEDAIYDALQAYRASSPERLIDLHVVFAQEDDGAFPSGIQRLYRRPG